MSTSVIARSSLSLDGAKFVAKAAVESATASGLNVVIAVVDAGGNLLYLERMDGAGVGSVEIAQRKARTSAHFQCESKAFEEWLAGGMTALLSLDLVPFGGGVPIMSDSQIVGAIGVSGGSSAQDAVVAEAGAASFSGAK